MVILLSIDWVMQWQLFHDWHVDKHNMAMKQRAVSELFGRVMRFEIDLNLKFRANFQLEALKVTQA